MTREAVHSEAAPAAIGTYSQAIRANDTLYISGQLPMDPATGELVQGEIKVHIRQVFANLSAIAEAAGGRLNDAVKINVYLTDLADFAAVNEIMAEYLQAPYPARAAVQVGALPRGATVEADAIIAL
ncbi:MAG: RidA family protein [Gammaproteobacteria bacterium]